MKEQLQQCLSAVWRSIQQTAVDEVTDKLRQCFLACVYAK